MTYLSSENGFLGLPAEDAVTVENAKAVIIPFGLEASVSYGGGTALGPQAMIDASHEVELFDDEFWCEPVTQYGLATLSEPEIQKPLEKAVQQLDGLVDSVLAEGKFPVVFGGEHSILAGCIAPYARRYKEVVILHFDAHADLRDGYEGEHYSHASAICRALDHENVSVVSFGIRNISQSEIPVLEKNKDRIKIYWAREKENWNITEIAQHFKNKDVYISFDLDGFDSSLMAATGTPEPGGLMWHDAMKILRAVAEVSNFIGADVNELAPIKGFHGYDFLAAKLAYKILNYTFLVSHARKSGTEDKAA